MIIIIIIYFHALGYELDIKYNFDSVFFFIVSHPFLFVFPYQRETRIPVFLSPPSALVSLGLLSLNIK